MDILIKGTYVHRFNLNHDCASFPIQLICGSEQEGNITTFVFISLSHFFSFGAIKNVLLSDNFTHIFLRAEFEFHMDLIGLLFSVIGVY